MEDGHGVLRRVGHRYVSVGAFANCRDGQVIHVQFDGDGPKGFDSDDQFVQQGS